MVFFIFFFVRYQRGEMLYARGVRLAKDAAKPLKPSSSQATRSHSGKARSYELKALNETMLRMRRNKSLTISDTQHRTNIQK